MSFSLSHVRRLIFGISPEEATFARRGFARGDAVVQRRLEQIGRTFLHGYHEALADAEPHALGERLNAVAAEVRGFAFEGAAMGLTLLDRLMPGRRNRLRVFLEGPGAAHAYMLHVGVGWALARLPWRIDAPLAQLDPLLRWLAVDGYGFHEGYFHWRQSVNEQEIPRRISGYAGRAFDQGLGRSLWFVSGGNVRRIQAAVDAFAQGRQADLWSGAGLACAYAGGADRSALEALRTAAGRYWPHLAQGVAFAAKARQRASNPATHTELACEILCGLSADAAATMTDVALNGLPPDCIEPAYEVWRRRIQEQFAEEAAIA